MFNGGARCQDEDITFNYVFVVIMTEPWSGDFKPTNWSQVRYRYLPLESEVLSRILVTINVTGFLLYEHYTTTTYMKYNIHIKPSIYLLYTVRCTYKVSST